MKKVEKFLEKAFPVFMISAFVLSSGIMMSAGAVEAGPQGPEGKITICHRTSSHQNPYNQITVDKNATVGGHDGHDGGVYPVNPWGDIIPPFTYGDGSSYPGKNWTNEGQAIWNNSCEIPGGNVPVCGDGILDSCEECDEGENNGTECNPEYGSSCTYCSNECTVVELQGPYCDDGNIDDPYEECEADTDCSCDETCTECQCVGEPPQETNVTLCKEDDEGAKLGGWELSLLSDGFSATGTTEGQCQNTGCVTFEDVPYGTYEIGEVLKEGWENISGLGEVEVNSENPIFTIVNREAEEVDIVTIVAYKVVCEEEQYLPDWGKSSAFPSQISESLVNQHVADSEGKCWFEPDWEFEWGEETAPKKDGNYIGYGGEGWTTFGPTDSQGEAITEIEYLEGREYFWVREVLQEGYIPFAHPEEGWDGGEPMESAEMLCHVDGYKYDNYDRIDDPQANSTYYCVAFNAPVIPETTNVTLCKEDDEGAKLGGWELSLLSDGFSATGTTEGQCQNTGCVTFEDVPYGTYEIGEVLKEGWENISGLGEVEVNSENPIFTIVNREKEGPPVTFYGLTASTTGFGWVTSSPEGINCGYEATDCEEDYEEGTEVTLTAIPGGGQKFDGWGGDCSGTTTVCVLIMDESKSVTAAFSMIPGIITYTVTFDGNGGTPTSTDVIVMEGETVDPLPTATRTGFDFVEWNTQSDGSGDEFTTSTVVIDDITVYAIWQEIEEPVYGCTDPVATNYDPDATEDDGSCTYPPGPVYGCTDPSAANYNPDATEDDGSCTYPRRSGGFAPGQILGEKIVEECGIYLYEYIQYGADNNPEEVKKLQIFLNQHMGSTLPITGIYDWATMQVLNQFQVQYKEEVLRPWVEAGTHCDENEPTGYVYKTTKRWINLIMCPTLNIPMPDLSGYPQADCEAYWQAVLGEEVLAGEDGLPEGEAGEAGEDGEAGEGEETPFDEEITIPEIGEETETEGEEIPAPWLIAIIIVIAIALIWFIYKGMKR